MAVPLAEQLLAPLLRWPGVNRYLVAFSGGLDSTVLLHALTTLAQTRPWFTVQAIHVHHGLHPEAADWQRHCSAFCESLGVSLQAFFATVDQRSPEGLEAAARLARYRVLAHCMQANDALLMAHHANDQWETLLMRLHRGAGLRGLAGIPASRRLGPGWLLRPFLDLPRTALVTYAQAHRLEFIEDSGNADLRFDRGFLRSRIVPGLEERWPAAAVSAARSAAHLRTAAKLLDEVAGEDLCRIAQGGPGLDLAQLLGLSPRRRDNLLRYWIADSGFALPSSARFRSIVDNLLTAREDATPLVAWDGAELRRYRKRLYLLRSLAPIPKNWSARWSGTQPLQLPAGTGVLTVQPTQAGGLDSQLWADAGVQVRFRRGGERLRQDEHGQSKSLSNWFQEHAVPPWLRERMPLVWRNEELIAIADRWRAPRLEAGKSGTGYLLEWQGGPPG